MTRNRPRWTAGLVVAAAALVWLTGCEPAAERVSETRYKAVLDEVSGVEFSIGSLTPDHSGSAVAYIHAAGEGRGLSIVDVRTLGRTSVELTNEAMMVNGWSPDDRHLAFVQALAPSTQKSNQFGLRESWLTLLDRRDGSVRRVTGEAEVSELYFLWLTTNEFLYTSRRVTNSYGEMFLGSLGRREARKVANYRPELVVMSEKLAGCLHRGNITSVELKPLPETEVGTNETSAVVRTLSDFKDEGFDQMKWLRHSCQTGRFLFCARPAGSPWRYLYEFNPADKALRQLSKEDTYNGQWIERGAGFAYVINTNHTFSLAVRTRERCGWTNLFTGGGLLNYTVAPDGNRIYITAAQGAEPHGIWEYDIADKKLRGLASGTGKPFEATTLLKPREFMLSSFDGVKVPCFLFTPTALSEGKREATKAPMLAGLRPPAKYPAVVYVPPTSAQFQKSFYEPPQFLGNVGFYFLAVNYRGCDGYGKEFSALASVPGAAKDVLAAYRELLKDPRVDKGNVFLSTTSGGSDVTFELLATAPDLWRGVGLDKPSGGPPAGRLQPRKLPSILMIGADADPALPALRGFHGWAVSNRVESTLVVYSNSTHFAFKTSERRDKLDRMARFYLSHMK